ncbi:phytanoyl-CoA dioxygenase family protein [Pelagibacterium sp. H642]|uniref:phytanoyl-CoA dioxygenase family protein n=1 Tax=Pelagibacterium sp. H642 TaxID=1881069 RepID=UPI00281688E4|nr:phytanoyl-CoA dioxygenase family protein [Pelagibacterium sp. H642]WMT89744.1 phytanoyl-CoA dioxygenase family protein [Pelagibacterium sp. H642]
MPATANTLTQAQIESFITDGFVRIDDAFPRELAEQGRAILWRDTGCDPDDPSTWTKPVIRLGGYADAPFRQAANTERLHKAYDQIVGEGRWLAPQGLGTFPIRFPSAEAPGDDGWHIDASYMLPTDDPSDFFSIRANIKSRGRALLMLFLFSDVDEDDAPTRIRVGSHMDMARFLLPYGEDGATMRQMMAGDFAGTARCEEGLATGSAGTVYLCHPFLVHAAQPNRGSRVKFMAQPPLMPAHDFAPALPPSPVQIAIRRACNLNF